MKFSYGPHRALKNPLYNNDCIYTPNVYVFKSDIDFPERIKKEDWWSVNIISWEAPNLPDNPKSLMNPCALKESAKIEPSLLEGLLTVRIKTILEVALANKNEALILGALVLSLLKSVENCC